MGMCLPCLGNPAEEPYESPDLEIRRKQQAEAAERRMRQQEGRGIRDPERVKQQQRRKEETERKTQTYEGGNRGGGLRWQVG